MSKQIEHMLKQALAVVERWPDERRHPIVADADEIGALAFATTWFASQPNTVRTICEVLYALGYEQAKHEPQLNEEHYG